jgi:hypothetical protein
VRTGKRKMALRSKSSAGMQLTHDARTEHAQRARERGLYELRDEAVALQRAKEQISDDSHSTLASFDKFLRHKERTHSRKEPPAPRFEDVESKLKQVYTCAYVKKAECVSVYSSIHASIHLSLSLSLCVYRRKQT